MAEKSRSTGHPVRMFFLGFFIALLLFIGALIGLVIFALNYKIDKISANKDEDGGYIYINADPETGGAENLLTLVGKVIDIAGDVNSSTLGEISGLVPAVEPLIEELEATLSDYVSIPEGELRTVKFGDFQEYVQGLVDRMDLSGYAEIKPDNAVAVYLFYGITDVTRDEETGDYVGKYDDGTAVYDCVLELDSSGNVTGASYSSEGAAVRIPAASVGTIEGRMNTITDDLTLGDVMTVTEDQKILYSLKDTRLSEIAEKAESLCLSELMDIDENDKILWALRDSTLNTLSDDVKNLTLEEMLTITEDDKILWALKDSTLNTLSEDAGNLTLDDLVTIGEDDKILWALKNSTLNALADDVNRLTVQQLFADDIYGGAESGVSAQMYLAVNDQSLLYRATTYSADYVYYTKTDGNVALAAGNGKLSEEEFSSDVYYTLGEGKILFDAAYLYYEAVYDGDGDVGYNLIAADGEDAGRLTAFCEDVYTYGAPSALWKLLLYVEADDGAREEKAYRIGKVSDMIVNVRSNTQESTLRELDEAGVLTFGDKSDLDVAIRWTENGEIRSETFGEMSLAEAIRVFVVIARNPAAIAP